jgi:hypothetical protein
MAAASAMTAVAIHPGAMIHPVRTSFADDLRCCSQSHHRRHWNGHHSEIAPIQGPDSKAMYALVGLPPRYAFIEATDFGFR